MGQTAFITGAATGIGMALAKKLDRMGWTVFAGVHRSSPDELTRDVSERMRVLRVDVSDAEEVRAAAKEIDEAVGDRGLSLLINNAALTGAAGPLECLSIDEFKRLMEVNFWGPLRVSQALLPVLRRSAGARIVMVTSASVHLTIPLGATYPTSKSSLAALTRHLRIELAPFGIEVTALEPGGVKTAMTGFDPSEEEACWASISEDLLPQYRQVFDFPGKSVEKGFEFAAPDNFADEVYRKVIMARRLKPTYIIGKGVAPLPLMHRLLPQQVVESIWRRFFGVRKLE
jgi:NAD(P)-dependent dehydrogenase (short-subunit alcohol dehydrogenase family)